MYLKKGSTHKFKPVFGSKNTGKFGVTRESSLPNYSQVNFSLIGDDPGTTSRQVSYRPRTVSSCTASEGTRSLRWCARGRPP